MTEPTSVVDPPTVPTVNPDPTPAPADPPASPPVDPPLGAGGQKALAAEREARKALEKQLAELAPLSKLAAALGGGDPVKGKTELETLSERQATLEAELASERSARWKEQVAHSKGFTPEQAELLTGATREELVVSADRLLALFPTTPVKPGTLAPDPSQGARGGTGIDLDARIAEAQKAGDYRTVISLQNQKLNK